MISTIQPIEFQYTNHKGVTAKRRIVPASIDFLHKPGYSYQPGWFLHGFDLDKNAPRSFALTHVVLDPDNTKTTSIKLLSASGG